MFRPEGENLELDLDWFAQDSQGSVGHFTTGGCGALPRSVTVSRTDQEAVRDYAAALPEIGASVLNAERVKGIRLHAFVKEERRETLRFWSDAAARGLYAFDYIEDRRRASRPYSIVARPEVPLRVDELPSHIREIVARTVLRDVVFARDDVIGVASLL